MMAHVPNVEMESARPRAARDLPFGAGARRLHCRSFSSQQTLRRPYFDRFPLELHSQFARELNCARCIAMNTNRFATHADIAAFDGAHFAFTQHPQDALCGRAPGRRGQAPCCPAQTGSTLDRRIQWRGRLRRPDCHSAPPCCKAHRAA